MNAPQFTSDGDWRKAGRLADRARLWAERTVEHTARMYSYAPGSNRYYAANRKAHEAEQKMLKAFSELTDLTAAKARGEQ